MNDNWMNSPTGISGPCEIAAHSTALCSRASRKPSSERSNSAPLVLQRRTLGPTAHAFPGQTMVFVSGDGTFYPCENCTSVGTQIGHCATGVDFSKAKGLLRAYARLCNQTCQGCWAWRLCSQCFIHCSDDGGRLSQLRKKIACQREKQRIISALRRYIYLLQNEPARASRVKNSLRHSRRLLKIHSDTPI